MNEELLTIKEVAEVLRISQSKLFHMWQEGRGPKKVQGIGRKTLVRRADLNDWIRSLSSSEEHQDCEAYELD